MQGPAWTPTVCKTTACLAIYGGLGHYLTYFGGPGKVRALQSGLYVALGNDGLLACMFWNLFWRLRSPVRFRALVRRKNILELWSHEVVDALHGVQRGAMRAAINIMI